MPSRFDPIRDIAERLIKGEKGSLTETVSREVMKGLVKASYASKMLEAQGIMQLLGDEQFRSDMARDFDILKRTISSQKFETFRQSWKVGRQLVGLQGRLVIEQAFWDLGLPWRSLITGFSVIK